MGKTIPVRENTVLLSIHDISPVFEDDILATYDRLQDLGISNFTLLVTPFFRMKKAHSFESNELFTEYIQSLDLEISLHGYSHFTKSGSNQEFHRMPLERLNTRVRSGISLIKKCFGHDPFGFIPPMWTAPRRLVDVVQSTGLNYCVIGKKISRLVDSSEHTTVGVIISQGRPSTSYLSSLVEIELGGPIQVALHPFDHNHDAIFKLIADMKDRLGYNFTGYRDYLFSL